MHLNPAKAKLSRLAVILTAGGVLLAGAASVPAAVQTVRTRAAGFQLGKEISTADGTNRFQLALVALDVAPMPPFNQSAVKQGSEPARLGPNPKLPYFTVRFAMPIPPENATNNASELAGIDPMVFTHNHSPGFEILPETRNGAGLLWSVFR